jgi:hypothetical protein
MLRAIDRFVDLGVVQTRLALICLAPDMVEAIMVGRQPKGLRLAQVGNGRAAGVSNGTPRFLPRRCAVCVLVRSVRACLESVLA